MLRNYLAAALRNMERNRFHAAIAVAGLAMAFAAALIITLFVRSELGHDRFIPDHERLYRISFLGQPREGAPLRFDLVNAELAAHLRTTVPEIEAVARLKMTSLGMAHGDEEYTEELYWADPEFFAVMPLRAHAGNLQTALEVPGSVVVTRRIARKYFGTDNVIGRTLDIRRRQTLTVTAVLDDPPANTHLTAEIFASGRAMYSALSIFDARPPGPSQVGAEVFTYLRVRSGVSTVILQAALQRFSESYPLEMTWGSYTLHPVPLTDIHFEPAGLGAMKPPGSPQAVRALSVIGALILAMAVINFANLMTARAARRAVEVGVRKAFGATRAQLAVQFIGEALVYAVFALLLALALVEISLPYLNALLDWQIGLQYSQHPGFLLALLAAAVATGVAAGIYPAWILASFRPRTALYAAVRPTVSGLVRRALVTVQFAILTGLLLATLVIHRQTDFALNQRLRVPTEELVMIRTGCGDAFRQAMLGLPGVEAAACSALSLQHVSISSAAFRKPDGMPLTLRLTTVDEGLFELFDLTPLAGRFFSRGRTADRLPAGYGADGNGFAFNGPEAPVAAAVINEIAARQLGASAQSALGKLLRMEGEGSVVVFEVVGVVADLPTDSIREAVQPTIYYFAPTHFGLLTARLSGMQLPATVAAISRLWKQYGEPRPLDLVFFDRYLAQLHRDIAREAVAGTVFSLVALAIACLGLLGLSASIAERRTREIGVRKAMGAGTGDVLRLLLWQFSRPVLWANLIAWPIAGFLMHRWLQGFAYRIVLSPWLFLAAAVATLVIALFTVAVHASSVARSRPVAALRHE